jgi:signal transduction histidine kinase
VQDEQIEEAEKLQQSDEIIRALQQQVVELTAVNQSLQEQLARKEEFSAMIAHELRGPLSPIINYAQLIARQDNGKSSSAPPRGSSIQRDTSIIISQARRLKRMINDLLDASHLTSGRFTLIRTNCDIAELAKEAVEHLRPIAPYHRFAVDIPEEPIIGRWDSGRLQQVLGNLLDNAIKYSDEGTTITTRVCKTQAHAHISVHNQGASIPSADGNQLFHPYIRLQATSKIHGFGLGLHITKSIVEAHGGTLQLEPQSEENSGGTTFSFDLPL